MKTRWHLAWLATALLAAGCGGRSPTGGVDPLVAKTPASPSPGVAFARSPARAFAGLPDRGELVAYRHQPIRQDGAYTWHAADVSEAHALNAIASRHLRLITPSGEALDVHYDRHVEHPSGDWTWIGHLPGKPGEQTILTFGSHAAFGTIAQSGKPPLRLTIRNGVSWLVETDPLKVAAIDNAATRPTRPDFFIPPSTRPGAGPEAISAPPMALSMPRSAGSTAVASTTVDVVLGYTPTFASDNGGTSGAITRLNYLVDVANAAYANSQITARVRLVATVPVSYADNTSNDATLEQLTGYDSTNNTQTTPNAAFNGLRAARDQYGADLVAMVRSFREPENGGCGIGWLIGGGQQGITASDSYFGYSVVSDGSDAGTDGKNYFCLDETLAHEMGHNMGAAHDVDTQKGDDGVLGADEYGVFAYSFGYKNNTAGYYTVMAYGDSGQHLYRIFSDPRSTFCGGNPCGTSQADNATTLTRTMPIVAQFRASVVPSGSSARNDINADGKSDLIFRNASAQLVGWWYMNGTNVLSTGSQSAGAAYTLNATGDFNGDGKADLAWVNSTRKLVLFMSNGSAFTSSVITNDFGSGWSLVGAGDINGDGRADLIFRNPTAQLVGWWVMNGRDVLSTGSQAAGSGYSLNAIGDFNADGLADLAWVNANRRLVVFVGRGNSFTSAVLSEDFGSGWALVGAGDINGDGRSDLIFRGATFQLVGWWEMNGTTVVATHSQAAGGSYTLSATGDFNADGKTDLAWTNAARRLVLFSSTGTGFTSTTLSSDFGSGWSLEK